jgi:hypothetical protein
LTPEERAEVLVTARLLRAAVVVQWLAIGLTVVAPLLRNVPAAALGALALFYAFRVALDARLFEDVATERLTTTELDSALSTLRKGAADRPWSDRCAGARRLVLLMAVTTAGELIVLVFGMR